MNAWDNAFERKWTVIFLLEYLFICLPFPFFYNTEYVPSFWGVPLFIFGWIAYSFIVFGTILVWWRQCVKRPEYSEYSEDDEN
ncbi:MAG: hypothetical protein HUK26_02550 [Duodenibacillus sp.]|nr:hypothetical protein [Duodenibacillus sp.]